MKAAAGTPDATRLSRQQWYVIDSLAGGARLSWARGSAYFLLLKDGRYEYHGANTVVGLKRRLLIQNSVSAPQVYTLTDAGLQARQSRLDRKVAP